ncbi:ferrochelatase [Escherichia coli]|nr:ferrochelatase [Escherichia coli]
MRQTKTGILLANLGTPDAPTPEAVKRYLKQFLSDRRVVDTSRLLWWPLLRGVILPLRSPRVAKLYASVWMEGGSPLMVYSRQQQQALAQRLPETPVALGMSYGSPSLESAVDELLAEHVDHIVVLPLYPQFSCSTVGAVWDELARILARKRSIPGISFIRDYPITTITLMHWRTAYALLLPNMANRICCCSLIMAFPSVMQMKAMIPATLPHNDSRTGFRTGDGTGKSDDDLSVALWPGTLADALYRRNAENARRKRRRSYTGDVPGLCCGLSGDAGRDCRAKP